MESMRKAIVVVWVAALLLSAFTSLDVDSLYAVLALTFWLYLTAVTLRYKQTEVEAASKC